jgi:hypothetical protein
MFLKCHPRIKDGKEHRYWSVVENRRFGRGKVVQRQVLYLGEINDSQRESWVERSKSSTRSASGPCPWHCFPLIGSCPTFATTLLHETVFLRPLTGSSVTFAR